MILFGLADSADGMIHVYCAMNAFNNLTMRATMFIFTILNLAAVVVSLIIIIF